MALTGTKIFLCYSREDADFAARLTNDLKAAGAVVSSYAPAGTALAISHHFIADALFVVAVLSPNMMNSAFVREQVETAFKYQKAIFPVIRNACKVPARLQLWTPIDFSSNYDAGLSELRRRMEGWNVIGAGKSPEPQVGLTTVRERPNDVLAKGQEKMVSPTQTTVPAKSASRSEQLAALQKIMKHNAEEADKETARRWASTIEFTGSSEQPIAFVSYSREDSEFVQRLAQDLKAAGARVWMDELDIRPGQKWAKAIEEALSRCSRLIVVLSPSSVNSSNVEAEINEALDAEKDIIPVIYRDCKIPFRLKTFQCADFRVNYDQALKKLLPSLRE